MKINIFIQGIDGFKRSLNIDDSVSIEEFKDTIENKFNLTVGYIVFGSEMLADEDDGISLKDAGFVNQSVAQVVQRIHGGQ